MEILVAEDDPVSRRMLELGLTKWGYEVASFADGAAAWEALSHPDAPRLAVLDWMMPEVDGLELCRRIRSHPSLRPYVILLTARDRREDLLAGLEAGADDYLTKPFDREELRVRLQVGVRVVRLQDSLAERVRELERAVTEIRTLQGLIPMCSYCKRVRKDGEFWQRVEDYITEQTQILLSHGICPDCYKTVADED